MGGLGPRAAAAVVDECDEPWTGLVTDVVTLGTPHLGAPLARRYVGHRQPGAAPGCPRPRPSAGSSTGARSACTTSSHGLAEDVPPLPHARYRLVSATLTRSPRHPVGACLGDLLVREPSAYGRSGRRGRAVPGRRRRCTCRGPDHFDLLNHPDVHDALRDWLA